MHEKESIRDEYNLAVPKKILLFIFFLPVSVFFMASRLSSLRNTLQKSTASVLRDGAKVADYVGPSIGSGTHGNYGALPKPMPISFFFKQEFNLKWAMAMFGIFVVIPSSFVPIWAIPFQRSDMKQIRKADEEFGPTRYGVGKKFFF